MTKLNLKIEHQVRGRIRLKVPSAKGNPDLLEQIKRIFGVIPGIEQVLVNPTTGSVVLRYDEDRHEQFQREIQQHLPLADRRPLSEIDQLADRFELEAEFLADHSRVTQGIVDSLRGADQEVRAATGNLIDLKVAIAAAVVGIAILEVGATAATPVWVALSIFSLSQFIETSPPTSSVERATAMRMD